MVSDQAILMTTGMALVALGIVSISLSRNLVKSVMGFQVAVIGANLLLFAAGLGAGPRPLLDAFVILSVFIGAAVESVGLAIVVVVYRRYGTLNPSEIRRLRR